MGNPNLEKLSRNLAPIGWIRVPEAFDLKSVFFSHYGCSRKPPHTLPGSGQALSCCFRTQGISQACAAHVAARQCCQAPSRPGAPDPACWTECWPAIICRSEVLCARSSPAAQTSPCVRGCSRWCCCTCQVQVGCISRQFHFPSKTAAT